MTGHPRNTNRTIRDSRNTRDTCSNRRNRTTHNSRGNCNNHRNCDRNSRTARNTGNINQNNLVAEFSTIEPTKVSNSEVNLSQSSSNDSLSSINSGTNIMADDRVIKEHLFEGSHYNEWRYIVDIGLH